MPASRTLLAALAVGTFAFVPAAAEAQQSKEAAQTDVAAWGQAISTAFTPGYWESEMQVLDATGTVVSNENKSGCVKAGESNQLGSSMTEMVTTMVNMADCTTASGGPGSLELSMECMAPGNKRLTLTSAGTYRDGQVDWNIDFKADGEVAPGARAIRITARRTKLTCS